MKKTILSLNEVKNVNPMWFAPGNADFFGDISSSYKLLTARSGKKYLVRLTSMWSDMFENPKKYVYRINSINQDTLKIEDLDPNTFETIEDVKDYLKTL